VQINKDNLVSGRSVKNTPIEKIWGDLIRQVIKKYKETFIDLEMDGFLSLSDSFQMNIFYTVMIPRLTTAMVHFQDGWNHHRISGKHKGVPALRFELEPAPQAVTTPPELLTVEDLLQLYGGNIERDDGIEIEDPLDFNQQHLRAKCLSKISFDQSSYGLKLEYLITLRITFLIIKKELFEHWHDFYELHYRGINRNILDIMCKTALEINYKNSNLDVIERPLKDINGDYIFNENLSDSESSSDFDSHNDHSSDENFGNRRRTRRQ
jgi:hypothetical protein